MERTVEQVLFHKHPPTKLKRVAAYARVSSGKDAISALITGTAEHLIGQMKAD